jgi:hypothetical protein
MERSHWVMFIVVSFVIGLILGFGFAFKASRVPELEKQVQQLTRENAEMKARVAAPPATPSPIGAPAVAGQPAKP